MGVQVKEKVKRQRTENQGHEPRTKAPRTKNEVTKPLYRLEVDGDHSGWLTARRGSRRDGGIFQIRIGHLPDHAIADQQVIFRSEDFVWARQAQIVVSKRQSGRGLIFGGRTNRGVPERPTGQTARLTGWTDGDVGAGLIARLIYIAQRRSD